MTEGERIVQNISNRHLSDSAVRKEIALQIDQALARVWGRAIQTVANCIVFSSGDANVAIEAAVKALRRAKDSVTLDGEDGGK